MKEWENPCLDTSLEILESQIKSLKQLGIEKNVYVTWMQDSKTVNVVVLMRDTKLEQRLEIGSAIAYLSGLVAGYVMGDIKDV